MPDKKKPDKKDDDKKDDDKKGKGKGKGKGKAPMKEKKKPDPPRPIRQRQRRSPRPRFQKPRGPDEAGPADLTPKRKEVKPKRDTKTDDKMPSKPGGKTVKKKVSKAPNLVLVPEKVKRLVKKKLKLTPEEQSKIGVRARTQYDQTVRQLRDSLRHMRDDTSSGFTTPGTTTDYGSSGPSSGYGSR